MELFSFASGTINAKHSRAMSFWAAGKTDGTTLMRSTEQGRSL